MIPPVRAQNSKAVTAADDDDYYDYDDDYYYSDEDAPPPGARGPGPAAPGPTAGAPPPFAGAAGAPPSMPQVPRASRQTKKSRAPSRNMGGDDDYYDDYYYDEEDAAEYAYEYEYDEEYAYEYEYEDEYGDYEDDYGSQNPSAIGGPAAMGGGPMGIDPSMLAGGIGNLNKAPDPEDRPKPARTGGGGMFGLTSTNLKNLRENMKPIENKKDRGGVNQQDFRGNLKAGGGGGRATGGARANAKTPAWAQMNLSKGGRPMTTNIQTVDTAKIKERVQAAKAKQATKQQGPRFMNGVPVGRVSVRRRVSAKMKPGSKGPPNGRVSARMTVNRVQDPNNPNKFIAKNRVSYKVKKRVSAQPGGRVSVRKSRNPNRVSARGVSRRVSKNPNRVSARRSRNPNRVSARKSRNSKRVSKNPNRISRNPNRVSAKGRVTRRHKRPNVSRTSVNQNIFGAKTAPDAEVKGVGKGDGCYLRFNSNDGGTLIAEWNVMGYPSNEALAYFKAGVPVPRFNYRRNDGKTVLMTGVSESSTKYYEGWTYFFAMAKEYEGSFYLQDKVKESKLNVKFVALTGGSTVEEVQLQSNAIDMKNWTCISVLPPDCEIFEGARTVDDALFMNISNQNGMAVKLR